MTTDKRPEDLTPAETMDAIFGAGAAEEEWSGADLERARQPYRYTPPPPLAHEPRTILLENFATGQSHWFSDAAIERAGPCDGGPAGWRCIAVRPEDWPDDADPFDGTSNVWLLHEES